MSRQAAVADRFYDSDPVRLRQTLDKLILIPSVTKRMTAKAVITPHAGYVYSGGVAGETFAQIEIPETVIILGPNHHGFGAPLAVGTGDWDMPLGRVALARDLVAAVMDGSNLFTPDNTAHQYEHSLGVQVPFLQYFQEKLRILPIVVSHLSFEQCQQAASELVRAVIQCEQPVLLVASTDMSHYVSREQASKLDRLALDRILHLNPELLYSTVLISRKISMCGIIPTTVILLAAMELGAERAELVRYSDSGEVSGDTDQVVGYAGVVIR
ncbi:MAG: AmmeMemoRadiSam system protein B [Candidatus Electrothrix sp. AR4]|nr:AmmeMemoRadiSam system protein B [Candidatus Electrothrix sp. AR4]